MATVTELVFDSQACATKCDQSEKCLAGRLVGELTGSQSKSEAVATVIGGIYLSSSLATFEPYFPGDREDAQVQIFSDYSEVLIPAGVLSPEDVSEVSQSLSVMASRGLCIALKH